MAIVAKITEQYDIPSGDGRQVTVRAVIYDDTDPNQTPLGQPVDITVDRDGFLNQAKSDAARKAQLAAALIAAAAEPVESYQKTATLAKSLVGLVVPLTDPVKG